MWRSMLIESSSFKLFVVDEAHMVINWGESSGKSEPFREWFGRLGEIRSLIACPALVITATASRASRRKLRKKLTLVNFHEIVDSPDRENIKLFVEKIKVKDEIREDMENKDGHIRVLIATSAAGMGVNYKSVKNIIHYGPPKDLDGFIQQLGRAGRDGTQSYELLIYSSRHLHIESSSESSMSSDNYSTDTSKTISESESD
uniref:DNA 3'-5' helicase n=1 Tax=Magallana gigas TaxID=29159 RepID=A0A8W8NIF3_MAGGI